MALKKILVATDHSDAAQRAEAFAGSLASADGVLQVMLLNVHPELPVRYGRGGTADVFVPTDRLSAEDKAAMEVLLSDAAARITAAAGANRVEISEDLVGGSDIAAQIVAEAQHAGVEAIVMGSRGRSDFAGVFLGSVSHKVLNLASCPVIVVR